MPVYLLHGFRWPRDGFTGIRVHAIVHNLEDCSVEYIQNENSRRELLGSFRKLYPDSMKELEDNGRALELIEQHDPEDITSPHAVSQPYAYIADKVITLAGGNENPTLSVNVEEAMTAAPAATPEAWEALADLRDKLASGEKIGWFVIYNGDPDRYYDSEADDDETSTPTQATTPDEKESLAQRAPLVPPKSVTPTSTLPFPEKPGLALPEPSGEQIPDPPKLKEVAHKTGFRKRFFGRKS